MEKFDIYFKIFSVIAGVLAAYHKYLMKQLEKKMDINDCSKQQEILLKERSRIEAIVDERTKTIFKQQKEIHDDLRIIKEYILKNDFIFYEIIINL